MSTTTATVETDVNDYVKKMQQGRKEMAIRCQAVADEIMKEAGVQKLEYHNRGLIGHASFRQKWVSIPPPTTRRRLYIAAHEAGHIALEHVRNKPKHRQEFEAERYAHDSLRKHGISISRKSTIQAKQYVAWKVKQAVARGAKKLDRETVKWCWNELEHQVKYTIEHKCISLCDMSRERRSRPRQPVPADLESLPKVYMVLSGSLAVFPMLKECAKTFLCVDPHCPDGNKRRICKCDDVFCDKAMALAKLKQGVTDDIRLFEIGLCEQDYDDSTKAFFLKVLQRQRELLIDINCQLDQLGNIDD